MKITKMLKKTEFYIFVAILLFSILVQIRSGQFYTGNNIVDILRSLTIPAIFCIGELFILISGGVDVSFPAVASLSMYVVSMYMTGYEGSIVLFLLVGTLLGSLMGLINGFLVAKYRFNPLIVTLGTGSLYTGILLGVFAAQQIPIPKPMYGLGKAKLFTAVNTTLNIQSDMPITFLFLVAIMLLGWFILNKTMLGRGIYAVGGDSVSAERAGFHVFGIQIFAYVFAGGVAGLAGVLRASMMLISNPTNLNGMEMTVIAACVLGGASIIGGKGSITGAILGMLLMTIMANSLILIGIPTYWQKVFTGLIILVGTGVSAYQVLQSRKALVSPRD